MNDQTKTTSPLPTGAPTTSKAPTPPPPPAPPTGTVPIVETSNSGGDGAKTEGQENQSETQGQQSTTTPPPAPPKSTLPTGAPPAAAQPPAKPPVRAELNFEAFVHDFKPVRNHINEDAKQLAPNELGAYVFDVIGAQWTWVKAKGMEGTSAPRIWSLMENGDIVPGIVRDANRVGYLLTEKPWTDSGVQRVKTK